jgi:hypothetical protein
MSVRLGQPAPGIAPRPQQQQQQALTNNPKLRDDPRAKDTGKGSSSSSSSKSGGSGDKSVSGGGKGGAKALQNRDGMDTGGQVGSYTGGGGFDGIEQKENTNARYKPPPGAAGPAGQQQGRNTLLGGQHGAEQVQQQMRQAPSAAQLDLPREQQRPGEREGSANAAKQALEGRAKLHAAVHERLLTGMKDVHGRLAKFIKSPGRLGVVNLSLVLSESSLTYELWKEPSAVPERRARMAQTLGVSPESNDAFLLRALIAEVHQCFVAFEASRPGKDIRAQYVEVLEAYEAAGVLPVMPGFDSGPMQAELTRLGMPHDKEFARSIFIDPHILAVGISPDDGVEPQVMVAGLTVPQLGTIVAQLRRLNPRLSNRQVLNLMLLASTDIKKAMRRMLGQGEVDGVQEMARQLLRLQAVELLYP